jgi:hypothetical protein
MNAIQEFLAPIIFVACLMLIINSKWFFTSKSISKKVLLVGFSLKAFSAILFGFLYKSRILAGGDTFMYFNDGNIIYNALKEDPFVYFKLAIGTNDFTPVPPYLLPYTDAMHFWFDSSNYFLVRINAIIRPFSFGVYNVHALVFAFLSFIGTYTLYLFFENKVYSKKILQFILFGIPSIVFWTSGVHKEAIVIFALGIILYNLDIILQNSFRKRNLFFALFGLIVLGYTRIYILAFLLPFLAAIIIYNKYESARISFKFFVLTILVFGAAAFLVDILSDQHSLMYEFLVRREYFINSPGNMTFQVERIPHNFHGALLLIWEAIINPFIRPLPKDCNIFLAYLASFETFILLLVIVILAFTVNKKSILNNPYAIFSILFGLSILFLIGLIVNNSGAIVRYRSIAIPFILIGFCLKSRDMKISSLFSKN